MLDLETLKLTVLMECNLEEDHSSKESLNIIKEGLCIFQLSIFQLYYKHK